jgi:putative transposase
MMSMRKPRMATLWEVPDGLWERIEPVLTAEHPPKRTGRKRVDLRRVLDGIISRLRTGCQWNHIPRVYGSDRTIHRYFQDWCKTGVFEKIWALLVEECDELQEVQWEWQAADTTMGKARFGGALWAPTPPIAAKTAPNAAC